MGIGFRELIILMVLFAAACIVIGVVMWLAVGRGRSSSPSRGQRPVADRLAEIEFSASGGSDQHGRVSDKQRAVIIASV